uniref:G domain-containing protein n=1 Tax=Heterorhabditis bacteriophora TaxID=37862 RepID=A0A1I7XCK2_HETBA
MHMSVQLKKMEGKLRSVHDARIPITGRNPQFFSQLYSVRPHILVMNKMDLINMKKYRAPIERYYRDHGVDRIVWTNCKKRLRRALTDLCQAMIDKLTTEPRYNRTVKTEYQIMVVGIPNVGKSSLINSLRSNNLGIKNNAVVIGARPGVTIRVQNRVRILDKPPIYILDTPGVISPSSRNIDEAMKLAACDLILESATSPRHVADYLLYWMNKYQ